MNCLTRIVAIPAGKCPLKLESDNYEDVVEWCQKVYSAGLSNNLNYLPSSLIFFAQQFFNISSQEYKNVYQHIQTAYNVDNSETNSLIKRIIIEENENKLIKQKKKEENDKNEIKRQSEIKKNKTNEVVIASKSEPPQKRKIRRK